MAAWGEKASDAGARAHSSRERAYDSRPLRVASCAPSGKHEQPPALERALGGQLVEELEVGHSGGVAVTFLSPSCSCSCEAPFTSSNNQVASYKCSLQLLQRHAIYADSITVDLIFVKYIL